VFHVIPIGVTDGVRTEVLVVKQEERQGCFPLVFFRGLDDAGLTVRVASAAITQLADAEKDASVAMWATAVPGTERVEVTAICDQTPTTQAGDGDRRPETED